MGKVISFKDIPKGWNKQVFGNLEYQIETHTYVIKDLDSLVDHRPLYVMKLESRSLALYERWDLLKTMDY